MSTVLSGRVTRGERRGHYGFADVARMEWIKLWGLRSTWWSHQRIRRRPIQSGRRRDGVWIPRVTAQLVAVGQRGRTLSAQLTPREAAVLTLMAEGLSNASIAGTLEVGEGTVETHVANIFAKLGLPSSADHNRRVLAVLRYLNG